MTDGVDISEDLQDGSDGFSENPVDDPQLPVSQNNDGRITLSAARDRSGAEYFIATSQGLLPAEALERASNTTLRNCIVIQDQTLESFASTVGLKQVTVGSNPMITSAQIVNRDEARTIYKYTWDDTVHDSVLPVRCKNFNGELHKEKFGSGSKGKCIKYKNQWFTPTEWEHDCGRASSKDWKRSIRYGGRVVGCLIEDGILQPHASSCTCSVCCEDEEAVGPVRLFTPYRKRRRLDKEKGDSPTAPHSPTSKPSIRLISSPARKRTSDSILSTGSSDVTIELSESLAVPSRAETVTETVHVNDSEGNLVVTEVTHIQRENDGLDKEASETLQMLPEDEKQMWTNLLKMTEDLEDQVLNMRMMVKSAILESQQLREQSLKEQRLQLENEKTEAVQAAKNFCQIEVTRALNNLSDKPIISHTEEDGEWRNSAGLSTMIGKGSVQNDSKLSETDVDDHQD